MKKHVAKYHKIYGSYISTCFICCKFREKTTNSRYFFSLLLERYFLAFEESTFRGQEALGFLSTFRTRSSSTSQSGGDDWEIFRRVWSATWIVMKQCTVWNMMVLLIWMFGCWSSTIMIVSTFRYLKSVRHVWLWWTLCNLQILNSLHQFALCPLYFNPSLISCNHYDHDSWWFLWWSFSQTSFPPWKLTWQWKNNHVKKYLLFKVFCFSIAMLVFKGGNT